MARTKRLTDGQVEAQYESESARLTQERNDFFLPHIVDFITGKKWINLRPEYQRRLVWDQKKQSRFIESLLMNVPIPPVFLYEYELSRYEVMDGQQRLNAIMSFYANRLSLKGLSTWSALNGRNRSECPPLIQRALDRSRISATVTLTEGSEERRHDVRRQVFERLNTGGLQLNAQELRNALYSGTFNDLIIKLARESLFRSIWAIPLTKSAPALSQNRLYRRMIDCEIVLRFFAFRHVSEIKGSVRSILDNCMKKHKTITKDEARKYKMEYLERLKLAKYIFGAQTFRIDDNGRSKLSQPLYDAVMVALDRLWAHRTALRADRRAISDRLTAR